MIPPGYFFSVGVFHFHNHKMMVLDYDKHRITHYTRLFDIIRGMATPQIAFDFTRLDLDSNREGHLSKRQLQQLAARRAVAVWMQWVMVIIYAVPLLLMTLVMMRRIAGVWLLVILIGLLGAGLVTAMLILRKSPLQRDLATGKVHEVTGRIRLSMTPSHTLHIAEQHFKLEERQFSTLKNGEPYRIYYLPHSQHILSLEALGDDFFE
jgi:hypothetical protein